MDAEQTPVKPVKKIHRDGRITWGFPRGFRTHIQGHRVNVPAFINGRGLSAFFLEGSGRIALRPDERETGHGWFGPDPDEREAGSGW